MSFEQTKQEIIQWLDAAESAQAKGEHALAARKLMGAARLLENEIALQKFKEKLKEEYLTR